MPNLRARTIRLAASLPKGSTERKALLQAVASDFYFAEGDGHGSGGYLLRFQPFSGVFEIESYPYEWTGKARGLGKFKPKSTGKEFKEPPLVEFKNAGDDLLIIVHLSEWDRRTWKLSFQNVG